MVLLLHLPGDHGAKSVENAMKQAIATLPKELARSITWDQGAEMANHKSFSVTTGIPVYFCDPHSPWLTGQSRPRGVRWTTAGRNSYFCFEI